MVWAGNEEPQTDRARYSSLPGPAQHYPGTAKRAQLWDRQRTGRPHTSSTEPPGLALTPLHAFSIICRAGNKTETIGAQAVALHARTHTHTYARMQSRASERTNHGGIRWGQRRGSTPAASFSFVALAGEVGVRSLALLLAFRYRACTLKYTCLSETRITDWSINPEIGYTCIPGGVERHQIILSSPSTHTQRDRYLHRALRKKIKIKKNEIEATSVCRSYWKGSFNSGH